MIADGSTDDVWSCVRHSAWPGVPAPVSGPPVWIDSAARVIVPAPKPLDAGAPFAPTAPSLVFVCSAGWPAAKVVTGSGPDTLMNAVAPTMICRA